jgi:hypothetical protein
MRERVVAVIMWWWSAVVVVVVGEGAEVLGDGVGWSEVGWV